MEICKAPTPRLKVLTYYNICMLSFTYIFVSVMHVICIDSYVQYLFVQVYFLCLFHLFFQFYVLQKICRVILIIAN